MDGNQIAVDLANDCIPKAQDSQMQALCQKMSSAHSADIQQLHDALMSAYQIDYLPTSQVTMQKFSMNATPTGTMSPVAGTALAGPGVVAAVNSQQGGSYDVAWLEAMTDVHSDLVAGANRVLRFNINPTLRTMVVKMSSAATAEIGQMQTMIARLGGNR